MTTLKQTLLGLAAAASLLAALPAQAQFQKPEDAVRYRQSAFNVMGNHMGRLGAMASGRVPFDANAAQVNADILSTLSRLPFAGFTENSQGVGTTSALPVVWSQPDKFKAAAQKMQDEVAKLNAAAKTGNADQFKAAFGAAAGTCKSCHDDFRKAP
jgi:cytochrome c556